MPTETLLGLSLKQQATSRTAHQQYAEYIDTTDASVVYHHGGGWYLGTIADWLNVRARDQQPHPLSEYFANPGWLGLETSSPDGRLQWIRSWPQEGYVDTTA